MDMDEGAIKAIAELADKARIAVGCTAEGAAETLAKDPSARFYLDAPAGHTITDITDKVLLALPHPKTRHGTFEFLSIESLIDYGVRMRRPNSIIKADVSVPAVAAVFDHHDAVNLPVTLGDSESSEPTTHMVPNAEAMPQWGREIGLYKFPLSRPWQVWRGVHGRDLTQEALAEHFEEYIDDVADLQEPDQIGSQRARQMISTLGLKLGNPSSLIAAARGIRVHAGESITQAVNTATGEMEVHYAEKHEVKEGGVFIPTAFVIRVPVFEGGEFFELLVRLQYRKSEGSIKWRLLIYQVERVVQQAFTGACEDISLRTNIPLFYAKVG